MDPKRDGPSSLLAPARGGAALSFPPSDPVPPRPFPPVDQHLVVPEHTRDEMLRGRKVVALPALAPHADAHADASFLLRPHVREGYRAALELLTRASGRSDFATDVSVRRDGINPATGERYLEELSFEIVNEQSMRDVSIKAEDLTERGVRRVFAIFVKSSEVCEWSRDKREFVRLDIDTSLEDPCFIRPIAIRALLDAAFAEREAARALERKGNPEILAMKQRERDEGRREMLFEVLRERFGELPDAIEAKLLAAEGATLSKWAKRIYAAGAIEEIFVEGQRSGPLCREKTLLCQHAFLPLLLCSSSSPHAPPRTETRQEAMLRRPALR
jgi:hypothetical protein